MSQQGRFQTIMLSAP